MYILLRHTMLLWIQGSTSLHLGYLILMDNYKRGIKTRSCCRGHLLPTVKTKVYLYTDIDIFKTKTSTVCLFFICLFVFWDEEGIKRNDKGLWEALEILLGGQERLWAHKTGHGSQSQAQNSFKNHLLIWLLTTL